MSFNRLQNEMRLQAMRAAGQTAHCKFGLVDAYDPGAYAVKVKLMPDETITGWLPIKSPFAGNGFGLQFGPTVGIEALVVFAEGDIESGCVVAFGFNDEDRPLPVPSGEAWLTHSSGSLLKFHQDGSIEMQAQTFNMTGKVVIKGDISQTGSMTTSGSVTASGDVKAGSISLQNHKHSGVQSGPGMTGPAQ